MDAAAGPTSLAGFAYGEAIDPGLQRSLGYRLLAPPAPEPWSDEVQELARALQAADFPDDWPVVEAFCSVLLQDGQRLIGLARYGLSDHTASRRRGGLELVGVLAPGGLGVSSALAIYRWLSGRRAGCSDLRELAVGVLLADVLAISPAESVASASRLPPRLWQEGGILLAAAAADDPDRHLSWLHGSDLRDWQWLPLIPPDFPLSDYARRGPIVAWRASPSSVH